jgi:hypothetical protein
LRPGLELYLGTKYTLIFGASCFYIREMVSSVEIGTNYNYFTKNYALHIYLFRLVTTETYA